MIGTDLDPLTRRALTDLDPAPASLGAAQQERAAADLDRILAEAPGSDEPRGAAPTVPAARARARRRLVAGGALAATLAAGIVGAQLLTGDRPASAAWTATPHGVTTAQQASAAEACRDGLLDSFDGDSAPGPLGLTGRTVRSAQTVLAERRGDWTLVVLSAEQGFDALCLEPDGPGLPPDGLSAMAATSVRQVGPRAVRVTMSGAAATPDGTLSILTGSVGAEVTRVVLHTRERGDVVATVAGERFAAWWPGADTGPGDPEPPPDARLTATLTFGDGTTATTSLRDGGGGGAAG